jgi:hypothetical protein
VNCYDLTTKNLILRRNPFAPRTAEDFVYYQAFGHISQTGGHAPMKLVLSLITLMIVAQLCHGSDTENDRKTLVGITAVDVVIEQLQPGASRIGLTRESLQTDVELKLRLAGMRVAKDVNLQFLYVSLIVANDARAAVVSVELKQDVVLVRDPTITYMGGPTWQHLILISNPSAQDIRDTVKDMVDKFLNAWLSVNPRRSPSQTRRPSPVRLETPGWISSFEVHSPRSTHWPVACTSWSKLP